MRIKLLVCFLIISISAGAQTSVYHPFPDSDAVWRVDWGAEYCALYNYPQAKYQYEIQGDTLIGTTLYRKIVRIFGYGFFICGPTEGGYMGGLREDIMLRKIYFVPKGTAQEELLYDFNISLGDTVRGYYLEAFSSANLIVTNIDSILIGTTYRKRFKCEGNYPLHTNYLVEGIGNLTSGLLEPPEMMDLTPALRCFIHDTVILYGGQCDLPNSTNNISNEDNTIAPFPNPATNELRIKNEKLKIESVEIYDVVGEKVFPSPLVPLSSRRGDERGEVFNVSSLSPGMYFVRIETEKGIITKKFIKQ